MIGFAAIAVIQSPARHRFQATSWQYQGLSVLRPVFATAVPAAVCSPRIAFGPDEPGFYIWDILEIGAHIPLLPARRLQVVYSIDK
jgi:hypothetical protein